MNAVDACFVEHPAVPKIRPAVRTATAAEDARTMPMDFLLLFVFFVMIFFSLDFIYSYFD